MVDSASVAADPSERDWNPLENFSHHPRSFLSTPSATGARVDDDPVREHVDREVAHIFGDAVVPPVYERPSLGGPSQRDGRTR